MSITGPPNGSDSRIYPGFIEGASRNYPRRFGNRRRFAAAIEKIVLVVLVGLGTLTIGCGGGGGKKDADADDVIEETMTHEIDEVDEPVEDTAIEEASPETSVDETADETTNGDCNYPRSDGMIALGKVMPALSWEGAFLGDSSQFDLRLEEFFCSSAYDQYSVLVFLVSAGWCSACPDFIEQMNTVHDDLEQAGALVVYMEIETPDGDLATNEQAHEFISHIIEDGPGVRVGDGSTQPEPGTISGSPMIQNMPTGFIVRRSDMLVIANEGEDDTILDYAGIAQDPESVWPSSNPDDTPNCGPDDEEEFEPNDTPAQATLLEPGAVIEGGICNDEPDYYVIEYDGHWLVQVEFSHELGDIDLFLWDVETNSRLVDSEGRPIGSFTGDDDEVFQAQGPIMFQLIGYNGATAPYTLLFVDL